MIALFRHLWIVFAAILAAAIVADSRLHARERLPQMPMYLVCTEIDATGKVVYDDATIGRGSSRSAASGLLAVQERSMAELATYRSSDTVRGREPRRRHTSVCVVQRRDD